MNIMNMTAQNVDVANVWSFRVVQTKDNGLAMKIFLQDCECGRRNPTQIQPSYSYWKQQNKLAAQKGKKRILWKKYGV
jgi:hypothetical protein